MKTKIIASILIFLAGYSTSYLHNKSQERKEYEPKESMVKNAFKIGCEFSVMKNNLTDKEFCTEHLNKNKELLRKLIESKK